MDTRNPNSINAEASRWVVRDQAGIGEAERRRLRAWLAASPEHQAAFDRISAMSAVFHRVRSNGLATSIVAELGARIRRRRARRRLIGVAAAAVLAACALYYAQPVLNRLVKTKDNQVARFEPIRRLPDGSIVELKDGAEIVVQFDTAFRRVALVRGEALFRVEHDSGRPFIVVAEGVEVRAVGTAFNVKLEAATVDVLVTEGKVRVDDPIRGRSLLPQSVRQETVPFAGAVEPVLVAGQEAVVNIEHTPDRTPARVVQLGPDEISRTLSWRIPRFDFDGVELGDAVQRINRMNRVRIMLADDSLARLRLSGTFSPDDPETFSRLVAATFGLRIEHQGGDAILLFRN